MPRLAIILVAVAAAIALPIALPIAAAAQTKLPTRDHAATYRIESEGQIGEMRVFFSAATRRQRVEMAEAGVAAINDLAAGRMLMLNEPARMVLEMPLGPGPGGGAGGARQPMLALPDDMVLTPTGTATVAGHRCTTHRAVQAGAERGTVCVTADGIMLRGDFREGGRAVRMEATALTLAPQPPSLFEVPAGWQRMQLPAGPPPGQPRPPQR